MSNYVVQVNNPPPNYSIGYFPRSFHFKKEAILCAKQAIENGASFARIECSSGGEIDFRPTFPEKQKQS